MLKLIKQMTKKDAFLWYLSSLLVLGEVCLEMILPSYMSSMTVMMQEGGTVSEVMKAGLMMLLVAVSIMVVSVIVTTMASVASAGLTRTLRDVLYKKVTNFDKENIDHFSISSLITRTTLDVTEVEGLVSIIPSMLVRTPVMAIWAIIIILKTNLTMSMVTGLFILTMVITLVVILLIVIPYFDRLIKQTDELNRITRETISGIPVVRAFNADKYQKNKFQKINGAIARTDCFSQIMLQMLTPVIAMCMGALSPVLYGVCAAVINKIDPAMGMERAKLLGDVASFTMYAQYVVMAFLQLIVVMMVYPKAKISAGRINEVLNTENSIKNGTATVPEGKGSIEFRHVSFKYPDSAGNALTDISFKIGSGGTLALIGATGCGKTTAVSLLARLYDVTEGDIFIDGIDIRDWPMEELYNRIGFATQKAVLFTGTVDSNINLGECSNEHTDENTWEALELAQVKDFVEKQQEGLQKPISQGGQNVSGGQKQRLSIARVLARKPEIMIFDDSFSALDLKTDAALRQNLKKHRNNVTKVIVAQRVSTIRKADLIVVLDQGRMVDLGTHDELFARCQIYKEIVLSQQIETEGKE